MNVCSAPHSVRAALRQQSRAGGGHPGKGRAVGMQTQSVAQTADNVEEERQTDTAQQEVQQISPAESADRRGSKEDKSVAFRREKFWFL